MKPVNVIDMLMEDHKQVDAMFGQYEGAGTEARDRLVHDIIQSLKTHATVEETVLYPFIRDEVPDGNALMDEAEQEHQEAKDAIEKLRALHPTDAEFDDAFQTLRDGVRHHVEEEESDVFPKLRDAADEAKLMELGQRLAQAKALSYREDRPAGG
jgi:iron-sulfur cluster repair protein YtfE (RIC family)